MKSHIACLGIGFLAGICSNRLLWMMGRLFSIGIIVGVVIGVILLISSAKKETK